MLNRFVAGYTIDYYDTFNAALGNSESFREYLEGLGLSEALSKNKIGRRLQHTILPYVSCLMYPRLCPNLII